MLIVFKLKPYKISFVIDKICCLQELREAPSSCAIVEWEAGVEHLVHPPPK